jgi:2-phospho-L-lactate guanylyltransferase
LIAAIPIKSFSNAKGRLGDAVPADRRHALMMALGARTSRAALAAGARVLIVSNDEQVLEWAHRLGFDRLRQSGTGLDDAATTAVEMAHRTESPWAILHADLPLVRPIDLEAIFTRVPGGPVLAPSVDGGTNVIAADLGEFSFAYGPDSYARHLRVAAPRRPQIVVRPGTAVDLDTVRDLGRVIRHPEGRWLEEFLDD